MAFSISLQVNASEKTAFYKELELVETVSGTLKAETSIIDPVILIEGDLGTIGGANYMTIPAFNRSYFITNIRSVRNGLVEVSAHVDVLSSFAEEILANSAIIRRQENNWNLYLNDGSFKVYQNPYVITKVFPAGFTTQQFVLAVAGGTN